MSGKDRVTALLAGKKQLGLCPMVKLRRVEKPTTIVLENINGTHDGIMAGAVWS